MSTKATQLWAGVQQAINDTITQHVGFPATVTSIAGNKVTIRTTDGTSLSEQYARMWGFDLAVNDYVYCVMVGGKPLIVGKIEDGTNATLSKNLTVNGNLTANGTFSTSGTASIGGTLNAGATRFAVPTTDKFSISRDGAELVSVIKQGGQERFYFLDDMMLYGRNKGGQQTWGINTLNGNASFNGEVTINDDTTIDTRLRVGNSFYTDHQFTHGYNGSTSNWALDAGNGNARFNGYVNAGGYLNTPWVKVESQVGSDISSTNSTSVYVVALTRTYTLAGGKWMISGVCGQQLMNGADSSVAHRMVIAGTAGDAFNPTYSSTQYTSGNNSCVATNVSGTFTVTVEYRSSGAVATSYSKNPWLMIVGTRTS